MKNLNWWNSNKLKLSLVPALVFWLVSMLCFVFGLSFQNPIGYSLGGLDISMWIAVGLSLANTMIQIIGNDQEKENMGFALYAGWIASYVLGIGSNINALISILHLGNIVLEWSVCISLGAMIEVLPEKLLVMFLKSLDAQSKPVYKPNFTPNKNHNQGVHNRGGVDMFPVSIPRATDNIPTLDLLRGMSTPIKSGGKRIRRDE